MPRVIGLSVLALALLVGPAHAVSRHGTGIAPVPAHRHQAPVGSVFPFLPLDYAAGVPAPAAEAPSVIVVAQPPAAAVAADRPPCRETTPEGVVVQRGVGCSHAAP